MSAKAAHIDLTPWMFLILSQLAACRYASQENLVQTRIVLLAFSKLVNQTIATTVKRCPRIGWGLETSLARHFSGIIADAILRQPECLPTGHY